MRQYHPGFNFDEFYYDYYKINNLNIKLPERFAGCTKNPDYDYRTGKSNNLAVAGKETVTSTSYKRIQGENGEYYVIFYGPETKTVKSKTEDGINDAIEKYREENPDIKLVEKTK